MPVFDIFKGSRKDAVTPDEKSFEEISVDLIVPNPNQPRTVFDEAALTELAQSIEQLGLIQPLIVRRAGEVYELVAGERRLRAVKMIGMQKVPCIIQQDMDSEDSALMAIVENLQRENLGYMEEAQCYAAMIDKYDLTQEQLAVRLGKSQSCIANKLRLLKLPQSVAEAVTAAGLSERHAREIIRLKDEEEQLKAVKYITENSLSVKDTERYISKLLDELYDSKKEGAKSRPVIVRMMRDYRMFMNTMNDCLADLRSAGMDVDVQQQEREDGVDISISVSYKQGE